MKRFFPTLPACVDVLAAGMSRASAIISAIACSAVVIELPKECSSRDARRGCRGHVDVVDADAGAADHLRRLAALSTSAFTFVASGPRARHSRR